LPPPARPSCVVGLAEKGVDGRDIWIKPRFSLLSGHDEESAT
jgi:hypothetical protein